jgi:tetratricopeptide (TPR) repeat protein
MTRSGGSDDRTSENDFSGEAEAVVQAGAVHGGIHFHDARFRFPPPRQLPGGTARFVNRKAGLRKLNQLLEELPGEHGENTSPAVVISAITGTPGVGKTALAVHWAHQVRDRFPDGDLYIDMRGYGTEPPLTEEQALDSFLRSLSVLPELIPDDPGERAALYRSLIADKRMLILIDNAASAKQVRNLLPGSRRCLVLVTTRGSLSSLVAREGASRVTLDVLSPADAIELFADIVGEERVEQEQEATGRIARLCGYLPLALRVVAERVAGQPYSSLADVAEELVSEQRRLDALASEDDPLTDVRAVFSWSYRALAADQQKLFRSIGLHAGAEFSTEVAAALVDKPATAVEYSLQQLARVHLVQEVGARRYRTHDLLHAYAAERCQHEEAQRERTHAVRRMLTWYLLAADNARKVILPYSQSLSLSPVSGFTVPAFDSVAAAMDWYEQERLNFLAAIQQAADLGQYDLAWKLPAVADGFFEIRSYWREWREIHAESLAAALTIGDNLGEASSRRCLGDVCWRNRDYQAALEHYERGAAIADRLQDPWIEGFAVRGCGLIYQELDQIDRAMEFFQRARAIFEAASLSRGVAMALLSIGKCYRAGGQLRQAAEYGERAVAVFRLISDRWSLGWGLIPLGEIYLDMGEVDLARDQFSEAISVFRDFEDHRSEALALRQLGAAYLSGGDSGHAAECWARALEIFEELGDPNADALRAELSGVSGGSK